MPDWLTPRVWIGLGIAVAVVAAIFFHQRLVSNLKKTAFDNGVKHEQARIKAWTDDIVVKAGKVSENAQKLAQVDFARIRGGARTLLVSGPGKAACSSTVPGGTSQPIRPNPQGSGAVAPMPVGEGKPLFGLPAVGAITLAENHDLCWAREKAWVSWYNQQAEIWRQPK